MVDIYSLIFKSIQSDLTKSGQSISIFGKEWRNVVNDIRNAKGLGNKISAAFSTAAQDLAMKANGAAVSEEALTAATNKLTISQRIATVASKAMGIALQVALNVGVALAINGIITLIDYLVNKEQKAIETANELGKAYKDQKDRLSDLKQEYLDIVDSSKSETEKTKDLYEWKKKLIKAYGYEKDAIEGVTTARATGLKFFDKEEQKDAQELINKTADEYEKAYKKVYGTSVGQKTGSANGILSPDALDWLKQYKDIVAEISDIDVENSATELSFSFGDNIYEAITRINEVLTGLNTLENNGVELTYAQKEVKRLFKSYLDEYEKAKTEAETILSETGSALFTDQFVEFLKIDENKLDKVTFDNFNEWKSKFVKYLEENAKELLKDANFIKIMDEYFSNLKFELFPNEMTTQTNKYGYSLSSLSDKFAELKDVINDASKNQATIQSTLEKIRQGTSLTTDEMNKVAEAYPDLLGKFRQTVDGWTIGADELVAANEKVTQSAKDAIDEQIKILGETSEKIKAQLSQMPVINSKSDYEAWQKRKEQLNRDLTDIENQLKGLDNLSETLTLNLTNRVGEFSKATAALSSKMKTLSSAFKEQKENVSLSVDTVLTLIENGYSAALMYDKQTGQIKLNADAYLELARAEIEKQKADILIAQNEALTDKLDTERSITSNLGWAYLGTAEAMLKMKEAEARLADDEELIKALQEQYDVLSALGDQLGTVVTGDYGGSKSGSSSDPIKEAFEKDMKDIEHLHNMGLASDKKYYDALEKANERYYKNSVDHESDYLSNIEKIYKARQSLYKDDADKQFDALEEDFETGRITANEYVKALKTLSQSLYGEGSLYEGTEFAKKELESLDKTIKEVGDDIYSEFVEKLSADGDLSLDNVLKDAEKLSKKNVKLFSDDPKTLKKNAEDIFSVVADSAKDALDKMLITPERYLEIIDEWGKKLEQTEGVISKAKELSESDYLDAWDLENRFDSKNSEKNFALREKRVEYMFKLADKLYGKNGQKDVKAWNELVKQALEEQKSILEDQLDLEKEYWEDRKDAKIKEFEEEIKRLESIQDEEEKINKAEELRLNLIKARNNLEQAKNNRNQLVFHNGTFEYMADQEAVMSAQEEMAEAVKEIKDNELQQQIDILKEQKDNAEEFYDKIIEKIDGYLNDVGGELSSNSDVLDIVFGKNNKVIQTADELEKSNMWENMGEWNLENIIKALGGKPTVANMANFMLDFASNLVGKQIMPTSLPGGTTNNNNNVTNNATKVINLGGISVKLELTVQSLDDFVNNKIDMAMTKLGNAIEQEMPKILAKA